MEFINYTINWCKGEIFEGKMSLLFGIIILIISLVYWKLGSTPYAKAMVIPIGVVALLTIGTSVYLITQNQKRIVTYPEIYKENPKKFIRDEKERTEAFMRWYPYTRYILAAVTLVGMLLLIVTHSPTWKAVGISLILFAFYGFVLDHFSEERAVGYHEQIENTINQGR